MRQHDPKPLQHPRRHTRPKLGNISLQIGATEVAPPAQADLVVGGKVAAGEAAPNPKPEERRLIGG